MNKLNGQERHNEPEACLKELFEDNLRRLNYNILKAWENQLVQDVDMEVYAGSIISGNKKDFNPNLFYQLIHIRRCHEIARHVTAIFFAFQNSTEKNREGAARKLMSTLLDDVRDGMGFWNIQKVFKKGSPYKNVPVQSLKDLAAVLNRLLILIKDEFGINSEKRLPCFASEDPSSPIISKVIARDELYDFFGTFQETLVAIEDGVLRLLGENIIRKKYAVALGVSSTWEESRDRFRSNSASIK